MTRILILGGTGYTGRLIAELLLEQSTADVTIATRNPDKAQAFADELKQRFIGRTIEAVYADASNSESLQAAFQGQNMVVVAAPTVAYIENVVRVALSEGVDYLDVQLDTHKYSFLKSLESEIAQAGRCFITEAGFHPGLPSALVRFAAAHLDFIESADVAGFLNMGKNLPYTEAVDELIEIFKDYQGQVYQNGNWTRPNSFVMRKIDFGHDIGIKRCYSMFFEELRALPKMHPSLKNTGFYISESHWMTDWVIMPMMWIWLKIFPRAVRPIGKLLWWGMGTFHKPPYRVELQVQATGLKDGQPVTVQASVSHPDGYVLTAASVVAALLQYMDKGHRKPPGLWLMGHMVKPIILMKDMEKMGLQCETKIQDRKE